MDSILQQPVTTKENVLPEKKNNYILYYFVLAGLNMDSQILFKHTLGNCYATTQCFLGRHFS